MRPFVGRQDPRDRVERQDAVDRVAVGIDGEGDAEIVERLLGAGGAALELADRHGGRAGRAAPPSPRSAASRNRSRRDRRNRERNRPSGARCCRAGFWSCTARASWRGHPYGRTPDYFNCPTGSAASADLCRGSKRPSHSARIARAWMRAAATKTCGAAAPGSVPAATRGSTRRWLARRHSRLEPPRGSGARRARRLPWRTRSARSRAATRWRCRCRRRRERPRRAEAARWFPPPSSNAIAPAICTT